MDERADSGRELAEYIGLVLDLGGMTAPPAERPEPEASLGQIWLDSSNGHEASRRKPKPAGRTASKKAPRTAAR